MNSPLPLVAAFLSYLIDERHFSPYTARCYGADLRQHCEFLCEEFGIEPDDDAEAVAYNALVNGAAPETLSDSTLTRHIAAAGAEEIRAFLEHLAEQHYSPATMARKIATLRSFYKWTAKRGLTPSNPMTLIRTPRQAKRLPKAITVEQIEQLLAAPDDREPLGARDRAMLETLYSTGIRVSELVDLDLDDLDVSVEALRVRGKGKKERIVPLGSHALAAIRHYINVVSNDERFAGA